MFTTIELFAGAGGLALGLEKAGFDTLGLIEFNKDVCDSLQLNRPNWNITKNEHGRTFTYSTNLAISKTDREISSVRGKTIYG